ncbi:MAG TPA: hypothetical protein VLI41_14955 [Phenylobacterium sp.]|nr:hypothetical protein [Phenylobacterium sp.]HSV04491.1 hypothetical protein [Phenylobacterium sp.]
MLRAQRLGPPGGREAAGEAIVGHVVEALQERDGDQGCGRHESQGAEADKAQDQEKPRFQRQVAEHPVAGTDGGAAGAAQAIRLEAPGLGELAHDRARQEGVEALAQPGAGGIAPGRRPAMVAVHVGDAEVHVEDRAQEREPQRPLGPRAAVDHVVGGDEAEHAQRDAGGERQARRLGEARGRARGHRRGPGEGGELQGNVEPQDQPVRRPRPRAGGLVLVAERRVEAGQRQRRGDRRGERPAAAEPGSQRKQGQEGERRAISQRRHAALARISGPSLAETYMAAIR